jgi:hypothetical protein
MARFDYALNTVALMSLRVRWPIRFRVWTTPSMSGRTRILQPSRHAHGFWQVRVRKEDTHKTAFKTLDGPMEWVAKPYGMCNALATFQRMVNDIMREF